MNPIDELVSELEHGVPCGLSRCYDTTDPRACMCARAAATITSLRLENAAMAKALGMAARHWLVQQAAPDLHEALSGLFGLLQMIGGRADITPELRTILVGGQAENHRITTARAALAKVSPQAHSPQDDTLKGIDP